MKNAKEEFLEAVEYKPKVKCAYIHLECHKDKPIVLKVGYSQADLDEFLKKLDFDYEGGFGCQNLYGNIWHEGGAWQSRCKYDDSEWWEYFELPKVPNECRNN